MSSSRPGCPESCRSDVSSGFTFGGVWIVEAPGELVWILGHDGADGFDAADDRYYASTERRSLVPDPAQWFESAQLERLRPIIDRAEPALELPVLLVGKSVPVTAHAICHDDAVREFARSGERLAGNDNFREGGRSTRRTFCVPVLRISGSGDV